MEVYASSPNSNFSHLVHRLLVDEHIPDEGRGYVEPQQKIVNVSKKHFEYGFDPAHSRHKKHIFWDITVIGSHKRYLPLSGIIVDMEGCKIRCSDMNNVGLKFVHLFLNIFR